MSHSEWVLQLCFRIPPERRHEFRQHVDVLLRAERPAECLERGLFLKMGEPGVFLWQERWSAADELSAHLVSTGHRTLVGAIRVLGQLEGECVVALGAREPCGSPS